MASFERMADLVQLAARTMELAGVVVIVAGSSVVILAALVRWWREGRSGIYTLLRQNVGRAILLGLEFLVAADIIRTVAETPTLQSVAVLGLIVLIRTFLSFTLETELTGQLPWRRGPDSPPPHG
jgi:uncharacterized membrane protein